MKRIDASCEGNPTLCEYNFVYMPYCSQDLWYGQRTAVSPETFGLYFSGRHIIRATLDTLAATHDLKGATEVILSGNSAGGFGVYNNVDYLQSYLPQARVVGDRGVALCHARSQTAGGVKGLSAGQRVGAQG